ncbi:MAG TPA: RNase adapter RapZ [Gammaproteobacteria bacterium]|nr:RNase adapter RapZ [Gammaproteobacteria bacterium]
MKLVIVSGLSGSGKSVALHTLEDLGYYCIDNLPAGLLDALTRELGQASQSPQRLAVGIDARNLPQSLQCFGNILDRLREQDIECEILFLRCDDDTLIKRFSETRRRHPLSSEHVSLAEAITLERQLLEPIAERAQLFIDTSQTTLHQLRDQVQQRLERRQPQRMSVLFMSFGFKHGLPGDADYVFDLRCLPNPHWQPELRHLTGRDAPVAEYLGGEPQVETMFDQIRNFLDDWIPAFEANNRSYLSIALGCTGGQHRSVYMAERLARHFSGQLPNVTVRHRELP